MSDIIDTIRMQMRACTMNIQLIHHNSMGSVVNTVQAHAVAVTDKYGMRIGLTLDENGHVQVVRGGNGYPIESDHE